MKYVFSFKPELCSACGACAVACMDQNGGDKPFRSFGVRENPEGARKLEFFSVSCRHCENAACIAACPQNCFSRDAETSLVELDNAACTGCLACQSACPFGAVSVNGEGKAEKCGGCAARLRSGLLPACVHTCPTGALSVSAVD